jgi:phage terminase large subunit GpA-like protein
VNLQFPAPSALGIMADVFAELFDPGEDVTPAEWAANNLVVPDGPRAGELFSIELTPYLVEPLNFWADSCPDNKDVVRKSKQTGFTTLAIAACGYTADVEPCDVFLIEPTQENLSDFVGEKLQRAIDGSKTLQKKIRGQTSRSNKGSTTYSKRYAGGSLLMGIATSTADLRGKTRKKVIRDEASEYPDDLGGQGSPHDMITGAYESFLASGDYKDLSISTPVVKGACYIDREFEAGDQRFWHVRCPHCCKATLAEIKAVAAGAANVTEALTKMGVFYFTPAPDRFCFNKTYPYEAHYVTPCCGSIVHSWQRNDLVRAGIGTADDGEVLGWLATAPGPGKHRSRHFDALSSPFVPWDIIAKRIVEAGQDPAKLKTLSNLTFGLAHDMRGEAPDHEMLMARRVEGKLGHIPPGFLLLTIAADVQKRGIYVEVLAHAPDQQTWPIYIDYLDGPTVDVDDGAFVALTELYRREWPDAYGNRWRFDEFVIDANYHTDAVYEWSRRHPGVKAIKGADGWRRVPLGVATDQDVDYKGKKVKGGAKLRLVGTWDLKSKLYEYLARAPVIEGSSVVYPPGYCHFANFLDDSYFRQLTAEYLDDEIYKGRPRKIWKQHGGNAPNHYLDCRVYNMAGADAYFSAFTADDWAERAKERGIPPTCARPTCSHRNRSRRSRPSRSKVPRRRRRLKRTIHTRRWPISIAEFEHGDLTDRIIARPRPRCSA